MKWHVLILSTLFLCILTDCSMIGMKGGNPVIGKWMAVYQSGDEIIFEFKPDMTMTCTIPDNPDYSFTANYSIDTSKNPITLNLREIESANFSGVCLAIARFNGNKKMIFSGKFGDPQQISYPTEFNKYSEFPDVYLEFEKIGE